MINLASALYGGDYIGDPDVATDDDFPEDADGTTALLGGKDVTVGGVSLAAGQTVTFVYSAAMVQPTAGNAKFNVSVNGGSGPGDAAKAVTPDPADATTIAVGDAAPGSGSGMVEVAQAVTINSTGNVLTFIYTPSGAITDRTLDIRVQVPMPVGQRRPTGSMPRRGEVTPSRTRRLLLTKPLHCKQPQQLLSRKSVRLIGRWLPVSNTVAHSLLVTKLSSPTRMLTLQQRSELPLSQCSMAQHRSRMPT